jgi:hypothetical protein
MARPSQPEHLIHLHMFHNFSLLKEGMYLTTAQYTSPHLKDLTALLSVKIMSWHSE